MCVSGSLLHAGELASLCVRSGAGREDEQQKKHDSLMFPFVTRAENAVMAPLSFSPFPGCFTFSLALFAPALCVPLFPLPLFASCCLDNLISVSILVHPLRLRMCMSATSAAEQVTTTALLSSAAVQPPLLLAFSPSNTHEGVPRAPAPSPCSPVTFRDPPSPLFLRLRTTPSDVLAVALSFFLLLSVERGRGGRQAEQTPLLTSQRGAPLLPFPPLSPPLSLSFSVCVCVDACVWMLSLGHSLWPPFLFTHF